MLEELTSLPHQEKLHLAYDPYDSYFQQSYDFIWIQHSVLPDSVIDSLADGTCNAYIVWAHLSPSIHIELPIFADLENSISDRILCVSEEVRDIGAGFGIDIDKVALWRNPAPHKFLVESGDEKMSTIAPTTILVVSNHPPEELIDAARILQHKGIKVIELGDRVGARRLTPSVLRSVDGVITIGKTVQYAFAAHVPVYNYDHFGGCGWISSSDIVSQEEYTNFSGRSTRTKKSAHKIAREIAKGWYDAKVFADSNNCKRDEFFLDERLTVVFSDMRKYGTINKQLSNAEANRWKVFCELHRGLYRTLEYYKDLSAGR